jgi:hypothetical protein
MRAPSFLFLAFLFPFLIPVLAGGHAVAATLPAETAIYSAKASYDVDNDHYSSTVISDHGRERRVIQTPYGPQTVLIDPRAGKAYLIQPGMGAFAMDLSSREVGINLAQLYGAPAEPLGRETIDGIAVTKYHVTARPADNASFDGFVWSTDDGIYVKVEGSGAYRGQTSHIAMRLTDIRREAQDPAVLQLPPGLPVLDANPIVKQLLQQGAQ